MTAKRTDRNQAELVRVLRQLGWRVVDLHAVPHFVDAIAHRGRALRLIEFKADETAPFTSAQRDLIDQGWPIDVLRSLKDCEMLR